MVLRKPGLPRVVVFPAFLLVYSCVLTPGTVIDPGYWPDQNDPGGIPVSRLYMEEAIDDVGRRWLIPGTGSNFIYRADRDGSNIAKFELESEAVGIAAGAGYVWVIPSNIDPDDKVVWITPKNIRSDNVYRIDPETGQVNGRVSLPVPYGLVFLTAGENYVWLYGRKQVGFLNFTHTFLATRIDAKTLQVVGTYELPNPVPLEDGREINALIEPQLLLINEAGYLLLEYWPKGENQPGTRMVLKFELDRGTYSDLGWPLKREEFCPPGRKAFLTKRAMQSFASESDEAACQ